MNNSTMNVNKHHKPSRTRRARTRATKQSAAMYDNSETIKVTPTTKHLFSREYSVQFRKHIEIKLQNASNDAFKFKMHANRIVKLLVQKYFTCGDIVLPLEICNKIVEILGVHPVFMIKNWLDDFYFALSPEIKKETARQVGIYGRIELINQLRLMGLYEETKYQILEGAIYAGNVLLVDRLTHSCTITQKHIKGAVILGQALIVELFVVRYPKLFAELNLLELAIRKKHIGVVDVLSKRKIYGVGSRYMALALDSGNIAVLHKLYENKLFFNNRIINDVLSRGEKNLYMRMVIRANRGLFIYNPQKGANIAAAAGYLDVLKFLFDLFPCNYNFSDDVMRAVVYNDRLNIVTFLYNNAQSTFDVSNALRFAIIFNNYQIAKFFLCYTYTHIDQSWFDTVIEQDNLPMFSLLCSAFGNCSETSLSHAAKFGRLEIIKFIFFNSLRGDIDKVILELHSAINRCYAAGNRSSDHLYMLQESINFLISHRTIRRYLTEQPRIYSWSRNSLMWRHSSSAQLCLQYMSPPIQPPLTVALISAHAPTMLLN